MMVNAAFVPMPGSKAGDKHAIPVAKATCSQQASVKHANHGKASVKKCWYVCRSTVVNDDLQHYDKLSTALHASVQS